MPSTPGAASRRSAWKPSPSSRSEEHTSELQSRSDLVCRLLLEKKKQQDDSRISFEIQGSAPPSAHCRATHVPPNDPTVNAQPIWTAVPPEVTPLASVYRGLIVC